MGPRKKKRGEAKAPHHHSSQPTKKHFQKPLAKPPTAKHSAAKKPAQYPRATIPFEPHNRILLLGEGDFSFSLSLLHTRGCYRLLPTCLDTQSQLLAKYPQAEEHIRDLAAENITVLYGVDATKLGAHKQIRWGLPSENGEEEDEGDGWDKIVFNFPHVGGKSTDVNRQVRYNQELLVSFFRSALPLLTRSGTILVTLFESEPYTLWNIRDLARHVGLQVVRSFQFQAEVYPGYKHARTLGNIEGGGGWKGEGRAARTYVFEGKGEGGSKGKMPGDLDERRIGKKRKRKQEEDTESDDGD